MKSAPIPAQLTFFNRFQLNASLIIIALMTLLAQPYGVEASSQVLTPDFCDANALRAFPEMPASLKCMPVPEPYLLDENGDKNSVYQSIIKNKAAAIALGKMLFWDSQVGSDGIACASCHFQAGADNRIKNQINPGMRNSSGEFGGDSETPIGDIFDFMATSPYAGSFPFVSIPDPLLMLPGKGANYTLKLADFPLRQYKEPEFPIEGQALQSDRNAEVVFDTDDVISSQGVYPAKYTSLNAAGRKEICEKRFPISGVGTPFFNVAGHTVRQVAPRNTPTIINAVYNFRNFWDGRANNVFNGLDPFGMRRFADPSLTPDAEVYVKNPDGTLSVKRVAIFNASLASQAVGPALSDVEMSCADKNFHELGKKMLSLKPLATQLVDPTDSVLGSYANPLKALKPVKGLKSVHTYKKLIQAAFNDAYWNVPDTTLTSSGYKLMENNFSLFWGLAIQAYEATLVSDDSRFDQAQEDLVNGYDILTDQEKNGLNLFFYEGKCIACHLGPELTAASVSHVSNPDNVPDTNKYIERMLMGDGGVAVYDAGFYNIGVRPSKEDLGVGGGDPYGFSLSMTRNAKFNANDPYADNANVSGLGPDPLLTDSFLFAVSIDPIASDEREAIDGAFKTPGLRNVELTGPYFHNGGQATLEQVVQFYNRGGDRKDMFLKDPNCGGALLVDGMVVPDPETGLIDSSGFLSIDTGQGQPSNISPDLAGTKELIDTTCNPFQPPQETLNLTNSDVDDIVAFMKTLTDERVRLEKAPFDHPSLVLPNGHVGNEVTVKFNKGTNQGLQESIVLPVVGSAGREASGLSPLLPFETNLQ